MGALVFVKYLLYSFVVLCVIVLSPGIKGSYCNQLACVSVVSKCQVTQSCECTPNENYCIKDCHKCLGHLFTECCSCLDMCPNDIDTVNVLSSQIGDFDGEPLIFNSFTADEDDHWRTIRFPLSSDSSFGDDIDPDAIEIKQMSGVSGNCTVVYLHSCTTSEKCMEDCEFMGSSSYRWFHDGCCECVGPSCYNYGLNKSLCTACPSYIEVDDDDEENRDGDDDDFTGVNEDDMSWDFGEYENEI